MKLKSPTISKKKIIGIIAAALVVILLLVWVLGSCGKDGTNVASAEYEPYTVTRGDITVSVTGSGTVQPIEQYEIQSIVTGDILEDYVTVGTNVTKDQVLYIIDSESAKNSIERSETSYEQQLISYNDKVKKYNESEANRNVYSPISGVITQMYVENGDEVNSGTKLCEISNTEYLTVRIPFLASNAANIYKNQSATVYFDARNESHTGYVSHVATGTYATEAGAIVSDVEITFKNPGAILAGETVTATVGDYACNDTGSVEQSKTEIVSAKVSGEIESLTFAKGDKINSGSLLLNIVDDSSSSDLRSSELSLENSRLSLDDQLERLNDYTILSPISGTVISKTMKAGDTLDGNKSSLAIVADMSQLTFEISVDELYIQSIEAGQTVTITADAVPDKTFEGVVDTVSIIGTASSGVTVYPVTIVISEYEGLLPGMNVDAQIVISDASDVLMIPVNAVSRGNLVLMKDDGSSSEKKNTSEESDKKSQGVNKEKKKERPENFPEGFEGRFPEGDFENGELPFDRENFKPNENGEFPDAENFPPDLSDFPTDKGDFPNRKEVQNNSEPDTKNDTKDSKKDSSSSDTTKKATRLPEAPSGYKYVSIEIGEANGDYVEVKSGLEEGDTIYVTVIKNKSTSAQSSFGTPGFQGGMGGGMPAGMPSGGMGGGMPGGMNGNRSGMSGGMGGMR